MVLDLDLAAMVPDLTDMVLDMVLSPRLVSMLMLVTMDTDTTTIDAVAETEDVDGLQDY
jgi:hypothetical protein